MVDIFVLAWNSCCIESMVGPVLWTLVSPTECKSSSTWDSLVLSSLPSLPPSLGNWLLVPSPLLSCPTPWCWSSSASLWPLNESAEWKDAWNERAPAMKEWLQCGWWLSLQVKKVNVCRWDVFLGLSKRACCSNRSAKKPDLNLRSGFGYAAYSSVLYSHRRSFSSDMLGVVLESSHWFFKPLFLGI